MYPLDKTPTEFTKIQLILFWITQSALTGNLKTLHAEVLMQAWAPCPAANSLSAPCFDLSMWPLQACHVSPPGTVSNKPLFHFLLQSLLSFGSPSSTLTLYLTNVGLTKISTQP